MLNQVTDIGPTLDESHPHLSPLLRIDELERQSYLWLLLEFEDLWVGSGPIAQLVRASA